MSDIKNTDILISGAGIAGPALAYWLRYYGFNPTIVEVYPEPRKGGYMIDFWGAGYDAAEKMKIINFLKEISYSVQELVFLGNNGDKKGAIDIKGLIETIDGRMLSFLRSDFAKVLYDITKEHMHYIFDDTITGLDMLDDKVLVTFKNRNIQKFDLIIGADGIHSNIRAKCFGKSELFEDYLGYYVCSVTLDNFLKEDFTSKYTMYSRPNRQVSIYSLRENKISAFFIFKGQGAINEKSAAVQKEIIKSVFSKDKWICKQLLERLDSANDFYFDSVSQVKMDKWSKGRVCLLGDAAFCPSLLSGQGASLSMAGAYTLAGELYRANGDYTVAFESYEKFFKPFVEKRQKIAKEFVKSFIPSSILKIWIRNQCSKFINLPFFSKLYWKRFLVDEIHLKDYEKDIGKRG